MESKGENNLWSTTDLNLASVFGKYARTRLVYPIRYIGTELVYLIEHSKFGGEGGSWVNAGAECFAILPQFPISKEKKKRESGGG